MRRRRKNHRAEPAPPEDAPRRPHATGRVKTPLPIAAILFSFAAHLGLALFLNWSPRFPSKTHLPAVVTVDLVAALPQAKAPAAASKPKPPPPPPKPKPEKKLLPTPELQRTPKKAKKPKPKPKPKKAKPKPEPPPRKEPEPEQDLSDVLAALREEEGTKAPSPAVDRRQDARPDGRGEVGVRISPEEAGWRRRAKKHVTRNWVLQPGFRRQLLETEVHVRLAAGGEVIDIDIKRRSGNPWYDESVERAIRKSNPLPAPERSGNWVFIFRPEDL